MKFVLRTNEGIMSANSYGGVAQLGEHLPCKQGVMSSNLIISTKRSKSFVKRKLFIENRIKYMKRNR